MTIECDAGTPSVTIYGPLVQTISESSSLQLPIGTYDVLPSAIYTDGGPIVSTGFVGLVTGSPAVVTSGTTDDVSVIYAPDKAGGYLWAPDDTNGDIVGFSATALQVGGGTLTPNVTLRTDAGSGAEAVAFSPDDALWAAVAPDSLWGWTFQPDGGVDSPVVINPVRTDGGTFDTQSLTFGPSGDLWVVDAEHNELLRYSAASLVSSGKLVPTQVIDPIATDGGALLAGAYGLAFDSSGNGWIGNGSSTVVELPGTAGGGLGSTPRVVLYDSTQSILNFINGLTFDKEGNLWLACAFIPSVVEVKVTGLSGEVDVGGSGGVAVVAIVQNLSYIQSPAYVMFDASGDLWIYDEDLTTFTVYTDPGAFSGSVGPSPKGNSAYSTDLGGDTGKFVFNLPAPGLGLFP